LPWPSIALHGSAGTIEHSCRLTGADDWSGAEVLHRRHRSAILFGHRSWSIFFPGQYINISYDFHPTPTWLQVYSRYLWSAVFIGWNLSAMSGAYKRPCPGTSTRCTPGDVRGFAWPNHTPGVYTGNGTLIDETRHILVVRQVWTNPDICYFILPEMVIRIEPYFGRVFSTNEQFCVSLAMFGCPVLGVFCVFKYLEARL
jgi:hypothetical protein